jgi:hypothetical protein
MSLSGTTDFNLDLAATPDTRFYVYAHTRPDGRIFYIGKGVGKRMHTTSARNQHWQRIVRKNDGFIAVKLADSLTETQALDLEAELIGYFRTFGPLANILDSGYQSPMYNPEVVKRVSDALRGIKKSEAHKAKLRGITRSAAAREKLRILAKNRTFSEQTRAKMRANMLERVVSAETCAKQSMAAKLRGNAHLHTPEAKAAASEHHPWRGKQRPEHSARMKAVWAMRETPHPMQGNGHLQLGGANPNAKAVAGVHPILGSEVWDTATAAAQRIGVSVQAVVQAIRKQHRSKGWKLEYSQ